MEITEMCGKGGVGKTNCATSLAYYLSTKKGRKVAIVDQDGGHSVQKTLGMPGTLPANQVHMVLDHLRMAVIETTPFISIADAKTKNIPLKKYLGQFPGNMGIIPLSDMVNAFFGILTDIATLQKFMHLARILSDLEHDKYTDVIIDVEPTAGLERLLSNAAFTVRSLRNLQKQGRISLAVLGAKWPDIATYLKGDYIRNVEQHCQEIEWVTMMMFKARHILVCTPEASPVSQTFEVRRIIEGFGGVIHGYISNNMRGESHEETSLEPIKRLGLPVVRIKRQHKLHTDTDRPPILLAMGEQIAETFDR